MSTSPAIHFVDPVPSSLSQAEFVSRFGTIYEHSAWIAQRTHAAGITADHDVLDGLAQAMADVLSQATHDEKLALIRAHPDLAGRAAARGELTDDSTDEQASAGLDHCTADELQRFHELNEAYKARFDFPFIKAVRGSNRHIILAAFEERLQHGADQEFETAINEINRIARLRLAELCESAK